MSASAQELLTAWMRIAPNVLRFPIFHSTDQFAVAYEAARRFRRVVHFDLARGVARLERQHR